MAEQIKNLSPDEKRKLLARLLQEKGARDAHHPASFAQQRLWFLEQLAPGEATYNFPFVIHFHGSLHQQALMQGLRELAQRQEALRTTFRNKDGELMQFIAPVKDNVPLQVRNLYQAPLNEKNAIVREILHEESVRGFDLENGPLMRLLLLQVEEEKTLLSVTMHHIITDGWSLQVFADELVTLYQAAVAGVTSALPSLEMTYSDYAKWQRKWMQGDVLKEEVEHWRNKLEGAPTILELPTDFQRPAVQKSSGATFSFALPGDVVEVLQKIGREHNTTLFTVLLSAFQVFLHRYSKQNDLLIGTPIAGRNRIEIERTIGFFVNSLIVRSKLYQEDSFLDFLDRMKEEVLDAFTHQDLPFERLVEELQPKRDRSLHPLFQVMFAYKEASRMVWNLEDVTIQAELGEVEVSKFDLTLNISHSTEALQAEFEYSSDLFKPRTIARMAEHFKKLLQGIAANPKRRLGEVPLITEQEMDIILHEWNGRQLDVDLSKCLHQVFQEQAERTPHAVAIVYQDRHMTYKELNQRANKLAHFLQKRGVGPEVTVGIAINRKPELIIGLLGILKAGGCYVPLDPAYPRNRLLSMVEMSQPIILLTEKSTHFIFEGIRVPCIAFDELEHLAAQEQTSPPSTDVRPDHLSYMIFTSGTTGQPKGVMVQHDSLMNAAFVWKHEYQLKEDDRFLQLASASFDVFTGDLARMIISGGTLVICPDEWKIDMPMLSKLMINERITFVDSTPALIVPLVNFLGNHGLSLEHLRFLVTGADSLSIEDYKKMRSSLGNWTRILNSYGVTEATIDSSYLEPDQIYLETTGFGYVSIGNALPNMSFYVLDENMQMQPIGLTGELYIGGLGVARGYLHREDLTAMRFVEDPYMPGRKMYRTGDLVKWSDQGNVEFLGRTDHQVKVRGFRIELGEIESILTRHPKVREAVVVAKEIGVEKRLVAYVGANEETSVTEQEMRAHVMGVLPDYMVPSIFIWMKELPKTPNGKLDRKTLQELEVEDSRWSSRMIAVPRDHFEIELVRIWETILQVFPIGIRDDFFDLGGHSLLLIRLLDQIQKDLQVEVPLSVMYECSTIEALALYIKRVTNFEFKPNEISLVTLQAGGTSHPILLVHPIGGYLFSYASLVRALGPDQPIYGLQVSKQDIEQSMEEIAKDYIDEVLQAGIPSPYLLFGHSFGGNLAFEIACQLELAGHEVGLVGLLDTNLEQYDPDMDDFDHLVEYCSRFNMSNEQLYELRRLNEEDRLHYILDIGKKVNYFTPDREVNRLRQILQIFIKNNKALKSYQPSIYPKKLVFFKAMDQDNDATVGWERYTNHPMKVLQVPGNHYEMIKPPNVQVLADRIREAVDEFTYD
ncbi:non-ribosomal peptide synthetase [Tumebacillus algifaecis]|nr:non-ribosomal peptide synthetase [Tumebacillus algifaecis]